MQRAGANEIKESDGIACATLGFRFLPGFPNSSKHYVFKVREKCVAGETVEMVICVKLKSNIVIQSFGVRCWFEVLVNCWGRVYS